MIFRKLISALINNVRMHLAIYLVLWVILLILDLYYIYIYQE
ncbi:DUF2770 family protein [Edaphovirga cremea]|jgi:hypothetical protein|nr:DUF2770 family protein [Edaphovirga cremea]